MRAASILTLLLCLSPCGCSSRASDDTGDSSEGGGETGDAELMALCTNGCVRFETCAPSEYVLAYADDQACIDFCMTAFSSSTACREAAGPYASCTAGLDCSQWPDLLDDPATSACSSEWAVAGPACGLI